jgi:hypothetical protein
LANTEIDILLAFGLSAKAEIGNIKLDHADAWSPPQGHPATHQNAGISLLCVLDPACNPAAKGGPRGRLNAAGIRIALDDFGTGIPA